MASHSSSSIFEYLKNVGAHMLDELYTHPPTCLVVFRELPELAKHIVMRLLFIEQPIPKSIVSGWVEKGSSALLNDSCSALTVLRIWHSTDTNVSGGSWSLNKKYQESIRISLFGGGKPLLGDLGIVTNDKYSKSVDFLKSYASERWDAILHFMVGSESAEVGSVVKDVLLLSNLMKCEGSDVPLGITKHGFHFLLMNRQSQVLVFILHYFDYLKENSKNLVGALQFVFQLSFLCPTKSYPVDALSIAQQEVLQHMRELGLAYQRKRTAPRFYVTPLALDVAGGHTNFLESKSGGWGPQLGVIPTGVSQSDSSDTNKMLAQISVSSSSDVGYILLETNFRLYAYTDSPLRTALLSLFSKIRARFPNLVVADITRDSVREALIRGITANQILSFLTSNAHPDMLLSNPILPPTLTDQIRLWELERDRFVFQEGCLYEHFSRNTDFELVRDYAKNIGVLLWENPERRLMVVSKSGHEDVRKFWKHKRPS
ncbi:General transcription factor IIH subunit 4 [Schistosoma japonicum]|nr:General transcription factor IIH subunit 4 [Schistosoma japonicum]KAH8860066.1 General transcription factor IIH subunit 4 [Schistosoma japonicum]